MRHLYEVVVRDIHPTEPAVEHTVRVQGRDARDARTYAERLSPIWYALQGIKLRGTVVAKSARRITR